MDRITTFDIHKEAMQDLLRGIQQGKIQLPDFQRSWVWSDQKIRELLSSISLAYPVGVVVLLQLGNTQVHFKPRLLEGVELEEPTDPTLLILDGQQRLTALFQSLLSGQPVIIYPTQSRNLLRRWYYIDIAKALDHPQTEREDAIFSLAERLAQGSDHSQTVIKEYEAGFFPLNQVFDFSRWRLAYSHYWQHNTQKLELLDRFEREVIKRFEYYQIPLIQLRDELPKEGVCQVFEKVNSANQPFTCFDLITATYAIENFSLREDWLERERQMRQKPVLSVIDSRHFMQALTLVSTYHHRLELLKLGIPADKAPGINCNRRDVLRLTLSEYKAWADQVMGGFEEAARLLHGQKIFLARDLPYPMQLVTLAALFTVLRTKTHHEQARAKLVRWYWCGVLGELYGGSAVSRAARDLLDVIDWIEVGGPEPTTVTEATFSPARLLRLGQRQSAAYRGIYALLLQQGAVDLRTGEAITDVKYFEEQIDSHHIFPRSWCRLQEIMLRRCNCIVNRTPLAAKTNRLIGQAPPSLYLERLEQSGISRRALDRMLSTHLIEPSTLRTDDFEGFFNGRMQALLCLISQAMGKQVVWEPQEEVQKVFALHNGAVKPYSISLS